MALAFASGALITALADTYREGGVLIAFATVAGFFLSFMIDHA